jgi:hypothetical protein
LALLSQITYGVPRCVTVQAHGQVAPDHAAGLEVGGAADVTLE